MTVDRFEDLRVWQTSRELANAVYDISDEGAFARDFGLKDQIRRAAVSVMSNVAEGFESRTRRLFTEYLGRAKASAGEVRAQLYLALDRKYIDSSGFDRVYNLADKASRQLFNLMAHLQKHPEPTSVREAIADYQVD